MCGIAGFLSFGGEIPRGAAALLGMGRQMVNRGPDDEGYCVAFADERPVECFAGDATPQWDEAPDLAFLPARPLARDREGGRLGLAHRRLSIVDLSAAGHQPMCTPDRRYWIVYNGEIYNASEVSEELKGPGVPFAGHSDTEVLLHAFREWGPDCLSRFNGMFAFAIWDDRRKTLFCARDRLGIKPFYYVHVPGRLFLFASDIKTLIASGLYEPRVDSEGLYHGLSYGVAPRPMTAFRGVEALRQGTWLEIGVDGARRHHRYWALPIGSQEPSMSEEEAVELVREKLSAAVRRRLVADVPVATFMSGGIDSSTVSAIAAGFSPGIKAFTLSFAGEASEIDELAQARATARMHPMEHIVRQVRADAALDHVDDMVRCYEEPCHSLAPNYVISQFVAENHIKVVLSGLGGDEIFCGYSHYQWLPNWLRYRRLAPLARMLSWHSPRASRIAASLSARSADRLHSVRLAIQTDEMKQALFSDPMVREFDTPERLRALYVPEGAEFSDPYEALSFMDLTNYVGNHHLYRFDQFTMRFSIEGRVPVLDHELVEAAFRVPTRHKLRDGLTKVVLRQIAAPLVDPSCLAMKKIGFTLPMAKWVAGPLKPLVEERLARLAERELFRPDEIERRYARLKAGRGNVHHVWQLVAVESWLRTFMDGGRTASQEPPRASSR